MEVVTTSSRASSPLWTNPTVGARLGEKVRFHVIGLGTAFHTFHLQRHRWLEPDTTSVIDTANLGPISTARASSLRPVRAWGRVNANY
jgi:hypothetical protein